jgi:hypothetical protein
MGYTAHITQIRKQKKGASFRKKNFLDISVSLSEKSFKLALRLSSNVIQTILHKSYKIKI